MTLTSRCGGLCFRRRPSPAHAPALTLSSVRQRRDWLSMIRLTFGVGARFVTGYLICAALMAKTTAAVVPPTPGARCICREPAGGVGSDQCHCRNRDLIRVAVARDPGKLFRLWGAISGPPISQACGRGACPLRDDVTKLPPCERRRRPRFLRHCVWMRSTSPGSRDSEAPNRSSSKVALGCGWCSGAKVNLHADNDLRATVGYGQYPGR
jgi:hypothetical protein